MISYRLKLPQTLWARVWSDLSLRQHALAWGRAFRSPGPGQRCDLIVRMVNYSGSIPDARNYSLLHEFFLFDSPGAHAIEELPDLFDRLQLRDSQLLVYVQPPLTESAGTWIRIAMTHRQQRLKCWSDLWFRFKSLRAGRNNALRWCSPSSEFPVNDLFFAL